jgi:deoxyribodipyrimidine photo-lyase
MNASIMWFRQDLRLSDNPALTAALESSRTVIPLFVLPQLSGHAWSIGEASRWWLNESLQALSHDISELGSRLIIRRGNPGEVLTEIARQYSVADIYSNEVYEPGERTEDKKVAAALEQQGITIHRHHGNLLLAPELVKNKSNAPYRVFTPFYRYYVQNGYATQLAERPDQLPPVPGDIGSVATDFPDLLPANGWYQKLDNYWEPGENGVVKCLAELTDDKLAGYPGNRDIPSQSGTSRLSPHLHFGEISPRQVIDRLDSLVSQSTYPGISKGRESLLRQLVWRDFACHILHHFPHTANKPFNADYERFPWQQADSKLLVAWQTGKTGIPIIDAGMRELWETGWMHNRVRMIVASLLTKNAGQHWLHGAKWFWDTLVDADLANNSMGWQWVAGCGVDAAPYFRIFNPVSQSKKFDPDGRYLVRWVPEIRNLPLRYLHEPWATPGEIQRHCGVEIGRDYPAPVIDIAASRKHALDMYNRFRTEKDQA